MIGAIVVPNELNACDRLSLPEAPSGLPNIATYGFAEICNRVKPSLNIKSAVGPENGLPEPSVDLGAVRPGGADRGSSQA